MTWQDELQRLDEERAAGQLSADDYQRRRAELTAQARVKQGDTAAPGGAPAQEGTRDPAGEPNQGTPGREASPAQPANPDAGPQSPQSSPQKSPFPPAFRWDPTPRHETTEVLRGAVGAGDADSAEQTQVVPNPDQRPPGTSYDDSERTQIVQARPLPPPPYGEPSYSRGDLFSETTDSQAWAQEKSAPPWVSADPVRESPPGWTVQGPESFEAEPKSPMGRIVAIAATVVVMAVIGVSAFLFFGSGGSDTAEPTEPAPPPPVGETTQPPPPTPTEPPGPPVADLPGRPQDLSHIADFTEVRDIGYLTPEEFDAWSLAGAGPTAMRLSDEGPNRFIVMAVETSNPVAGRDRLADLQLQFELEEIPTAPAGVRAGATDTAPGEAPALRRAHYVSGNYVVRVEVSGVDPAVADDLFTELLTLQLTELPADV